MRIIQKMNSAVAAPFAATCAFGKSRARCVIAGVNYGIRGRHGKGRTRLASGLRFSLMLLVLALPVAAGAAATDNPSENGADQARPDLEGHVQARGKPVPD